MIKTLKGRCHCGAVEYDITLDGPITPLRCDCSLCARKGALMVMVQKEKFRLIKGADALSLYQWNTRVAEHYFCRHCGVYTHHGRRRDPSQYGVNLGCLDGVDVFAFKDVPVLKGSELSVTAG